MIGSVFLTCALLMSIGLVLIEIRGLTYEDDYPDAPPMTNAAKSLSKTFFLGLGAWFALTSGIALFKAKAKQFQTHKFFIYRHVASGLWVAVLRLILPMGSPQEGPKEMRSFFAIASLIGVLITLPMGELAIFLEKRIFNDGQQAQANDENHSSNDERDTKKLCDDSKSSSSNEEEEKKVLVGDGRAD